MHIVLTTLTTKVPGTDIQFDCPACKAAKVTAHTEDRREKLKMFRLIPLMSKETTFVICTACQREFPARMKATELSQLVPEDVVRYIDETPPFLAKFLAITGALTCLLPLMGLVVAVPAIIVGRNHRGWVRNLSITAAVISLAMTGFGIYSALTTR